MNIEFLNFIAALVIIIVAAKVSGLVSTRLGQPAVLGELIAGIILGPTFPHEVVGFSGGAKYLFPGIAGPEMINGVRASSIRILSTSSMIANASGPWDC